MVAKKTTAALAETSLILSGPYAEPGHQYESIGCKRVVPDASAMDVVKLLVELPDDTFDAIRELQSAEDRHGLIDDEEDDA